MVLVQECGYIKTDGVKCSSPALRGKPHCFYHDPSRSAVRRAARPRFFLELPLLEHPGVVQAAVREITHVLADAGVYFRPAMRLLYALECATREEHDFGWGAKSSRPPLPPSFLIARAPGFGRIFSTAHVNKPPVSGQSSTEEKQDFTPNSNAGT